MGAGRPEPDNGDARAGTLEAALELVGLCDRAGRIVYANPSAACTWGLAPGDVAGKSWRDLGLPEEIVRAIEGRRREVGQSARPAVEEVRVGPTGVERVYECLLAPVPSKRGVVESLLVTVRDVTEARRAEEAVRESERQYRLLAENSTDMISRHDPAGNYLYVSPACRALVGREPEEMIGRSPHAFIHPEDLPEVVHIHETMLATAGTYTVSFRARRQEGSYIWLETTARAVRDPETMDVVEIQCATRDITRRKQADQELRESRELLQAVLDNCPTVIYIKDDLGRYLLVNHRFEILFHISRRDMVGKTDSDVFPLDRAAAFRQNDRKVLEAGTALQFEEVAPQDDGLHTYLSVKFPLFDFDGEPYAVCGISTDITPRRRAEEQLRLQNVKLQEAAESERSARVALEHAESQLVQAEKLSSLGQIVAGVAHEVNNPLAFVSNNVAVFQRDVDQLRQVLRLYQTADDVLAEHSPATLEAVRAYADEVDLPYTLENLDRLTSRSREGLRRIQQIVKDLREFARLDDGDLQSADLNIGVTSTVNIIIGRAKKQGIELVADLKPLPRVTCYPAKINQVVMNLLSNAIDATPERGKVVVRTEPFPEGDGVVIVVTDTGRGIDPSVRDRIFDPFFTTKPIGQGTGLGLSISYGIVKAHGGKIEVESAPGKGARFTVRLPLSPPGAGSGGV